MRLLKGSLIRTELETVKTRVLKCVGKFGKRVVGPLPQIYRIRSSELEALHLWFNKDIHMIVSHPQVREQRKERCASLFAAVERVRRGCSFRKSGYEGKESDG